MIDQNIDFSKIYSSTKLGMFTECPKSYHFSYLDPVYSKMKSDLKKRPENIWSFQTLGKAVHNAITLFYHLERDQRTKDKLKFGLRDVWQSEVMWNQQPPLGKWGGFQTLDEERDVYAQALQMLDNFFNIADKNPEIAYLPTNDFKHSIDDYKNLITPLSEDIDISGKFDLCVKDGGNLEIIDFKTGKKEESKDFQLRFYKALAEEKFQKPVSKASFYFLRTGKIQDFPLEESIQKIKEEILEMVGIIKKTEVFEARPGKLCKFCLFKDFCPEKEKVREILRETKIDDYSDDLPF